METAPLNEPECAEYCRKRGLYPQQITAWRRACGSVTDWADEPDRQQAGVDRDARKKVRALERELQRKEKALAPCDCAQGRLYRRATDPVKKSSGDLEGGRGSCAGAMSYMTRHDANIRPAGRVTHATVVTSEKSG